MFVPCPHCGFLVALIVAGDRDHQHCPRCKRLLSDPVDASSAPAVDDSTVGRDAKKPPGDGTSTAKTFETTSTEPRQRAAHGPVGNAGAADTVTSDHAVTDAADPRAGPAPDLGPVADPIASRPPQGTKQPIVESDTATTNAATAPTKPPAAGTPKAPSAPGSTSPRPRSPGAPSFARRRRVRRGKGRRWPGPTALAVLTVILLLQLLLAQRGDLAADPRSRPFVTAVCSALFCNVPPWREPEAFTMIDRSVQPATKHPGTLQVQATFRNDARWAQPWPTLLVTLSDKNGHTVGQRAFTPAEYLGGKTRPSALLVPQQSAGVAFRVLEPAPGVVAFTFDFR